MKIQAKYLVLIAAAVWMLAGLNVLRLGVIAIEQDALAPWLVAAGFCVVFFVFHPMFSKLVGKHSDRIREYGNEPVWPHNFFDRKSYIMMGIMMGGGIALRAMGVVPAWFVAFFYTAVGAALALAGVGFLIHYIKRGSTITCPVTGKSRLA